MKKLFSTLIKQKDWPAYHKTFLMRIIRRCLKKNFSDRVKQVYKLLSQKEKWILKELIIVIIPFGLSSYIRHTTCNNFDWYILDYSSIAFSFFMINIYLLIELYKLKPAIDTKNEKNFQDAQKELNIEKKPFVWFTGSILILFIAFFVYIEFLQIEICTNNIKEKEINLGFTVFFLILTIITFLRKTNFTLKVFQNNRK